MGTIGDELVRVSGRGFTRTEVEVVTQVVADGQDASRAQLMERVCRGLDWRRPSGALKIRECRDLLERWLPEQRKRFGI